MVEVLAQMVASVVDVRVVAGSAVSEGDVLLVVETMKMEIPIVSPVGGIVADLRVQAADIIAEGDVLAVIEPVTAA